MGSFPITNGEKQGCVIAPTLFSMVFAAMFHDASQDNDDDIQLKYRTDGGVFNLRRLKAKTKVKVATLRELFFVDDYALSSNTEAEMQQCVNNFSRALAFHQHQEDRSHASPCTAKDVSRATHLCE